MNNKQHPPATAPIYPMPADAHQHQYNSAAPPPYYSVQSPVEPIAATRTVVTREYIYHTQNTFPKRLSFANALCHSSQMFTQLHQQLDQIRQRCSARRVGNS